MAKLGTGFGRRILRRAGLASMGRLKEVTASLARAESRIEDLRKALDQARETTDMLRKKLREHEETARQREEKMSQRVEKAREGQATAQRRYEHRITELDARLEREVKKLRERDADRVNRVNDMRERLDYAEKSARLGREHLMAIEVKLDIVEGAIKVLDQRTRAALMAVHERQAQRSPAGVP